jgi:hypothetical protein
MLDQDQFRRELGASANPTVEQTEDHGHCGEFE